MKRHYNGRYRIDYFQKTLPVLLMFWTAVAGLGFKTSNIIVEAWGDTPVDHAEKVQISPTPTPQLAVIEPTAEPTTVIKVISVKILPTETPTPTPTQKEVIVSEIERVFGDDAPMAKKIVECESMWNPSAVGDKNLLAYHSGEVVGDSIGLFQIRTGGWDFNRAKANGMTADEFRQEMFDPIKNIRYAKTIFDRSGWRPWSCSKLVK